MTSEVEVVSTRAHAADDYNSQIIGPNTDTFLHSVRFSQVLSLKDTIWRDMREVAEEVSATAETESMRMMTELAKRDARITQLGSRIEDLQVQSVRVCGG